VPPSAVTVQFSNSGGNPLSPVISSLAPWSVTNGDIGIVLLNYTVQASPSAPMIASSITATGQAAYVDGQEGDSFGSIAETITPMGSPIGVSFLAPPSTTGSVTVSGSDSVSYGPQTSIGIYNGPFLYSPPQGANPASLTRLDNGLTLRQ
jgi:hypothetical protein